jgi:hypothetical protein
MPGSNPPALPCRSRRKRSVLRNSAAAACGPGSLGYDSLTFSRVYYVPFAVRLRWFMCCGRNILGIYYNASFDCCRSVMSKRR